MPDAMGGTSAADPNAAGKAGIAVEQPQPADPTTSPSALLRPDRRLVPFTGRDAELEELRAWSTSSPARAVRVLVGAGGVGKSRLAVELAAELEAAGDHSRFVLAGDEAHAVESARAVNPRGRLLLVLDDVEIRTGLATMLESVLEDRGPIRVLLVTRSLGEWWDRLIESSGPAVVQLLTCTLPIRLGRQLAESVSDAELAAIAAPHFARALSIEVPERVGIERAARRVPVLLVHAAALAAVLRHPARPGSQLWVVLSEGALDELLEHEARYWRHAAATAELADHESLVKQVVAAGALIGAGSVTEAAEVLARIPELAGRQEEQRLRWAKWLYDLYPAGPDGRLGSPRPHLLAEAHVVGQLAADPVLTRVFLRGLTAEQAEHALTVLARASTYQSRPQQVIAAALRDDLPHLGMAAARVALHTWGEVGRLLTEALADTEATPEVLAELALDMPYPSAVLARAHLIAILRARESMTLGEGSWSRAEWDDRAALVLAQLPSPAVDNASQAAGSSRGRPGESAARPGRYHPELVRALTDLSIRFAELGRPADALRAEQEAAATYRELVADDPTRYRPELATSLTNLGTRFAELGRPADALRAEQEAAATYRELAATDPARYRPELATCLTNLGVWYAELGRAVDAVAPAKEAVTIFRELAAASPHEYRTDLAAALTNLAIWHSQLGSPADAISAEQEAVTIRRELATADPAVHLPDLATSLTNLGIWASQLGRPADALRAEQEAVILRRELATDDPARYLPDLATSLTNLVITLSELGRPADAIAPAKEAVTIRRELAASDPARHRPHLARTLSNLATRYAELGRAADAVAPAKEAVIIRRELATVDPVRYRPDLARALGNLGSRLRDVGKFDDAVTAEQEAAGIYRELAVADPDRYRPALSASLGKLAEVLSALGRTAEAEAVHAEAGPVHAEAEPVHAEAEPVHAEAEPVHAEAEPVHAEARPVHAEAEPVQAESGDLRDEPGAS